ncbi:aminopeptidase P family protein [Saccharicrinis sp. FJH62]|uniref:aminopeptidase P family protein n=1 Tax=Saccharicrinis sp. FJH62 TaxID=3344657 RepID=UPI0035D4EE6A
MFQKSVYVNRRDQLKKMMGSGLILLPGNNEMPMNYEDNTYRFRQDSTFLYFFGHDQGGLTAAIDVDNNEDIFFADEFTSTMILWMGSQETMAEKAQKVGAKHMPMKAFGELIANALKKGQRIHILPPYRADRKIWLGELLNVHPNKVETFVSEKLLKACIKMRSVKEAVEIEEIRSAMPTAYAMHTTAMKMAKPGLFEREIAGRIEGIAASDAAGISFPIILTKNGHILHNHVHPNELKQGDLMVVDAGCSSFLNYATDHTRTTPVGGKFTQKQKEIYQIVLNANEAAREATRAGVYYRECHLIAAKTIASGLKDLGLMKGNVDDAVTAGAHALFFPHGLGHHMGLDVHDMEDYGEDLVGYDETIQRSQQFGLKSLRLGKKLETGYVITNEPGCYFIPHLIDAWQADGTNAEFLNFDKINFYRDFGGIRLEDDILVTENGCELLGERIPITVEEVEAMCASGM